LEKRAEIVALEREIDWQIARKRGAIKAMVEGAEKETLQAVEQAKASRAGVGGTPLPQREEPVRPPESAVSRPGQERASTLHALWTGQCEDRRTRGHDVKQQESSRLKKSKQALKPRHQTRIGS
jgi:hypothetical protein